MLIGATYGTGQLFGACAIPREDKHARTPRHVIPWTSYGQGVTNPKEERYA